MKSKFDEKYSSHRNKNLWGRKNGIIILKNVFPFTPICQILRFLRKYGNIKKTFFFNCKNIPFSLEQKGRVCILCMVEFTKKSTAKRFTILSQSNKGKVFMKKPFEEAFYLKKSEWNILADMFR